jgi:hypothetical protein
MGTGITVTIRDPSTGQYVPAGVALSTLTGEDHFFHTKDIGRIDDDGSLYGLGATRQ